MMWEFILEQNSEVGLSRQIFMHLKESILAGAVTSAEPLPSTRELAKSLGVSRNTVSIAYDMLWSEGYIIRSQGAPSRVAEGLQIHAWKQEKQSQKSNYCESTPRWDFKTGQPDLHAFPWGQWNRAIRHAAQTIPEQQYAYSGPKGYEPLCEEIARWLFRARNMRVDTQNVFITSGSTQALHLLLGILHGDGGLFALENPSHPGVRTVIDDHAYPAIYIPVDGNGADIRVLKEQQLAAVYLTPSHQYPLGSVLTAARRTELIRLAQRNSFYIIEDDYDSEFRYAASPVSPMYSMDASCVIYVGTFSKTIFPALRIGFVVLPDALQKRWRRSRNYMDVQNPILEQAALYAFLKTRDMDKHIRRMRRLYGDKRRVLLDEIRIAFGDAAEPGGDASGLHITLRFPGKSFTGQFAKHCKAAGIRIAPVSQYCADRTGYQDTLLIGYGHIGRDQIHSGIQALSEVIQRIKDS